MAGNQNALPLGVVLGTTSTPQHLHHIQCTKLHPTSLLRIVDLILRTTLVRSDYWWLIHKLPMTKIQFFLFLHLVNFEMLLWIAVNTSTNLLKFHKPSTQMGTLPQTGVSSRVGHLAN